MTLSKFIESKYYWDAADWENYMDSLPNVKANELKNEMDKQNAECYQLNHQCPNDKY